MAAPPTWSGSESRCARSRRLRYGSYQDMPSGMSLALRHVSAFRRWVLENGYLRFMRTEVQPPVIECPWRIVVGRGLREFLRKGRAQRFGRKKLKVAMEHERAQIILEFPIAC